MRAPNCATGPHVRLTDLLFLARAREGVNKGILASGALVFVERVWYLERTRCILAVAWKVKLEIADGRERLPLA
jgi:hypothetical protein